MNEISLATKWGKLQFKGEVHRADLLRTVPTNSKVFLRGLLAMREKQILTSVIEIQRENWG